MELKVGDKVKIIGKVFWIDRYFTNEVGIVISIERNLGFPYTVGVGTYRVAIEEFEIEKVSTTGQLLFPFMTKGF